MKNPKHQFDKKNKKNTILLSVEQCRQVKLNFIKALGRNK